MERINKARETLEDFEWYCEHFLSVLVGKHTFSKNKKTMVASKITTKSDEALLLLHLENSIATWTSEYKDPEHKDTSNWAKQVYTRDNREAKKYKGWSDTGMARFRFLMKDHVPKIRDESAAVETELMNKYSGSSRGGGDGSAHAHEVITLLESEGEEEEV